MHRQDLEDMLRARLTAPPPPPLEATRRFLSRYVSDADGFDDIRQQVARTARMNTRVAQIQQALVGIEGLLADPPPPGALARLVAVDGNLGLDDPTSDAAAAAFLRQLADMLQEVLSETQAG